MNGLRHINLGQIQNNNPLLQKKDTEKSVSQPAGPSFSEQLKTAVEEVDQMQKFSDKKLEMLASGEDVDIHGTMIALQEADISIRMMSTFKDKVVESYKTLINMAI